MKLIKAVGVTSEIWQVFIADSSSSTGAGLTGLAFNTGSLVAYYHRDTDTTATAITLVTMTVGTFTSSGFKEIDATNMPGWYQFCPPNAALASGAKSCAFHLKGASNMAPLPIEVQLSAVNFDTATNMGLTGIPTAAPGAAGGMFIAGTNAPVTITGSGDALTITSSGGNGKGVTIAGNGSGAGLVATGGATGHGLSLVGGATSGDGLSSVASTSGHGITATGVGTTKHGVNATGGATTSHGISATGGATSGSGISAVAAASGSGIVATGAGTTKAGIIATGGATTSAGLQLVGGGTSGDALLATTTSGHGINLAPVGTSKHGLFATGGNGGTSDGISAVAGTGGVPIRGDITGNITGSIATLAGSAGIKKNAAKAGFMFLMTDSTTHAPKTGVTVTATRSLDGAAFGACANAVSEISNGWYKIDLAATDLNGNTVALLFTGAASDNTNVSIVTGA